MTEKAKRRHWPGEPEGLWPRPMPSFPKVRLPDDERIARIDEGVWIDHRVGRQVRSEIDRFLGRPWGQFERWRGMLLVGDASNGKSSLLARLASERPYRHHRLLFVRTPASMARDELWSAVLGEKLPAHRRSRSTSLQAEAMSRMSGCEGVVFENASVLSSVPDQKRAQALTRLKDLGGRHRVPVIVVATPTLASKILSHPDWGARFETLHLPRWRIDGDYLDLLAGWEAALPLEGVSHLAEREMALHLYSLCDGIIGRLATVLRQASLAAIECATERITIPLLDAQGFSPPQSFRSFLF